MFKNKKIQEKMIYCFVSVFFWGMLAHGYALFQNSFSHDSLRRFFADNVEEEFVISLGRIFQPVYRAFIRGQITVPWLIGVLSIFWCGLLIYVIVNFFEIESKITIFFMSGIMMASYTAMAWCATYIFLLDTIFFGVLSAAISAYLWRKTKNGFIWGIPFVVIALGIYQSNISIVITMIMLVSFVDLLKGNSHWDIIKKGGYAIIMLISGGVIYGVTLKIIWSVMSISPEDGYNGLTNMYSIGESLLLRIKQTYMGVFFALLNPVSIWPKFLLIGIIFALGIVTFILIIRLMKRNKNKLEKQVLIHPPPKGGGLLRTTC